MKKRYPPDWPKKYLGALEFSHESSPSRMPSSNDSFCSFIQMEKIGTPLITTAGVEMTIVDLEAELASIFAASGCPEFVQQFLPDRNNRKHD